ncbi:PLP-dependent transferase, partial [Aureobasidium melanogenum]
MKYKLGKVLEDHYKMHTSSCLDSGRAANRRSKADIDKTKKSPSSSLVYGSAGPIYSTNLEEILPRTASEFTEDGDEDARFQCPTTDCNPYDARFGKHWHSTHARDAYSDPTMAAKDDVPRPLTLDFTVRTTTRLSQILTHRSLPACIRCKADPYCFDMDRSMACCASVIPSLSALMARSMSSRLGSVTLTPMWPKRMYWVAICLWRPPAKTTPRCMSLGRTSGGVMPLGRLLGQLLEAEVSDGLLDLLRCLVLMIRTGHPVLPRAKVGGGRDLAALERLDGTARSHDDAQTSWASNGLLRGSNDTINSPVVKLNLLTADTADTIDNDHCVGADLVDELAEGLDLTENAGRGVDMGDGDELVFLLLQGLLDLVQLGSLSNGSLELGSLDAVCLETIGEAVGKVASVQDQDIITRLSKVGSNLIPSKSTRTGDDKGLRCGILGLEKLAEHGQGLAKCLDKGCADMGFAAINLVIELDGAWDEQGWQAEGCMECRLEG